MQCIVGQFSCKICYRLPRSENMLRYWAKSKFLSFRNEFMFQYNRRLLPHCDEALCMRQNTYCSAQLIEEDTIAVQCTAPSYSILQQFDCRPVISMASDSCLVH